MRFHNLVRRFDGKIHRHPFFAPAAPTFLRIASISLQEWRRKSVPRFEPAGAAVDQQRGRLKFSNVRVHAIQRDRSGADRKLRRKTEPSRILSDQDRTHLRTEGTPLLLWC